MIIAEVWFSSPERSRTARKLAAMDDTGLLEGHTAIPVGRPAVRHSSGAADRREPCLGHTGDDLAEPPAKTALALAGLYVLNQMWTWVVVTWRDPLVGRERTVYFRDGSARGFGGRMTDIHAVLTAHLRGQLVFDAVDKQDDAVADLKTPSQFQDGRNLS